MKVSVTRTTLALMALSYAAPSFAQSVPPGGLDVSELMTAREFSDAGLQKLTRAEIESLNAWLAKYTAAVLQTTIGTTAPSGRGSISPTPEVIESRIDDDFEGWDGDTIFRLRNGQIWQQVSYAYTYHYAYAPKVLSYRIGAVYKMKVDGVSGEIAVRRLR